MSRAGIALAGMHKLTALDYPGVVSAIVFTQGCNFHCPYCHNPHLRGDRPGGPALDSGDVLAFLAKRAGLLDGLVISGGEPCLQPELEAFCREVKGLGYLIKLDSNGSRPGVLGRLVGEGLVDYVAMDCKSPPGGYASFFCREPGIEKNIRASARLLRSSGIAHEFRTTCVSPFVTLEGTAAMAELTGTASPWFLQKARLDGPARGGQQQALSEKDMRALASLARRLGVRASVR